jgi:metal-responsive CopG/Arc/MetJ family transcriptional regulator
MSTKYKTSRITISMPSDMLEATEEQGRLELRNRSEMIREALRYYLTRIPTEPATRGDVATLEQGRREIARGEYVTLNQLRYEMDGHRRSHSTKAAR